MLRQVIVLEGGEQEALTLRENLLIRLDADGRDPAQGTKGERIRVETAVLQVEVPAEREDEAFAKRRVQIVGQLHERVGVGNDDGFGALGHQRVQLLAYAFGCREDWRAEQWPDLQSRH